MLIQLPWNEIGVDLRVVLISRDRQAVCVVFRPHLQPQVRLSSEKASSFVCVGVVHSQTMLLQNPTFFEVS